MRTISIAITHFNRFYLLMESFAQVLDDPRVSEVVISDDKSTDGSEALLLKHFGSHPKVRLFWNPENVDCYRNKKLAVERCTNDWVVLFDSDNVMGVDYLDAIFNIKEWQADSIYCPDFAKPHFNFRSFSGRTVNSSNVAELMTKKHFPTLLNAANYLVPRAGYCSVWDPGVEPHTSDTIYMAYRWLKAGNRIHVVWDLEYYHRIHEESHYKLNRHKTGHFAKDIEARLRMMR